MDTASYWAVQEGMLSCRGVCAALFISLFAALLPAQQDRLADPIDGRNSIAIRGSISRQAQPKFDLGAVEPGFQLANITLFLRPSPAQQTALEQLLDAQQDPTSPDFHRWLTPESYADRFAPSAADFEKIAAWLRSQGFAVKYTARGRDFISFSGTASQVRAALHTEIHRYQVGGRTHFANATDLSLPRAIESMVAGITGLHDFRPRPFHKRATSNYADAYGGSYLAPADFATIYNLNPLYQYGFSGAGQNIVIVGQSDIDPDDIATFRALWGLPETNIEVIPAGDYPGFSPDDEVEADLDLEWSGAVAPNANLIYVFSDDVSYASYYAIDNNIAPIISESFGLCEYTVASNRLDLYHIRVEAQKGNAMGITWLASSGDSGAAGCDADATIATQGLGVSLPASVPEVTAVGGTGFNEGAQNYWNANGNVISYIPEMAWNDTLVSGGLAVTGGGVSSVYNKPTWQSGPGVPADTGRDVPDLSLTASNAHDPYLVISKGVGLAIGGTSASAPSFAGIVALLNQYLVRNQVQTQSGVGNINPKLYSMAASGAPGVFNDITKGNNVVPCGDRTPNCINGQFGYSTNVGYDLVTGLGSVDAYNLITVWSGLPVSATTTTLSVSPAVIMPSGSAAITATVQAASGSRTPTGLVIFTLGDNALGSGTLSGTGTTASASITVYGSQILAANNTVQAAYQGSPLFTASSATGTITAGTPAATSSVTMSVTPNPVHQQTADANGATFTFTIQLKETAGVATTVTGFTFDGMSYSASIANFFGATALPAHGALSATLHGGNIPTPSSVAIVITGRDASGATWTQTATVLFEQ